MFSQLRVKQAPRDAAFISAAELVLFLLTERGVQWVYAGIAALAGGVLVRHVVADLVAGIVLRRERAFASGNAISTGNTLGRVVKIGWLKTTLAGNHEPIRIRNSTLAKPA